MAIAINHSFVCGIADVPADVTAGKVVPSQWNSALVWSGLGTNALLYSTDGTTLAQDATNLIYSATGSAGSGPVLKIGSGTTTAAGWIFGTLSSGNSGIWASKRGTPDANNYVMYSDGATLGINASATVSFLTPTVNIVPGGTQKVAFTNTAGKGPDITAGTATTDVQALSATQTWNNAAIAFTGFKYTITDTASAAGSLAMQILGGASGTTNLFSIDKNGFLAIPNTATITGYVNTAAGLQFTAFGNPCYVQLLADAYWRFSNQALTSFGHLCVVADKVIASGDGAANNSLGSFRGKYQSSDGTAGAASFGPGLPTSITVKDGIITAIS